MQNTKNSSMKKIVEASKLNQQFPFETSTIYILSDYKI
jgi:hypothetical protein